MDEDAGGEDDGAEPSPLPRGTLGDRLADLRAVTQALAEVDPLDLDGSTAASALHELQALAGRLEAVAARVLPVVEADGSWALAGWRSFASWLAMTERISVGAAKRQIRLARALRDELPGTARAAAAGQITLEHAQVLSTLAATSDRRRAVLAAPDEPVLVPVAGHPGPGEQAVDASDSAGQGAGRRVCNESFLLEQARVLPVDQFRAVVRRWAAAANPDADERGYRRAQEREFFELSHTLGGYHVGGFLTVEHGLGLQAALDAVMGVPAKDDARTRSQRRAQAVADLGRMCLDAGLAGAGGAVRPHLSVVVEHDTLTRLIGQRPGGVGPVAGAAGAPPVGAVPTVPASTTVVDATTFRLAEFADGQPVPRSVLATLACDSAINRIIFGARSAIIDVGRKERTFTGTRRRAIVARDRHCRYPGRDAPPALGEIHHREHWVRDRGRTSVATGVLLCWFHHHRVHQLDIEIHLRDGKLTFLRADGRPL